MGENQIPRPMAALDSDRLDLGEENPPQRDPYQALFPLLSGRGRVVPLVPGQPRVGFSELGLAVVGISTITGAFGARNFPTTTGLEILGSKGHWYHPD